MTGLGLAVSSLSHRRVRTLFVVLSVAIAIAVLTVTLSVRRQMAAIQSLGEASDEALVFTVARDELLPFSYVERVRKIPGAEPVWWGLGFRASDGQRYEYNLLGASDHYIEHNQDEWFHVPLDQADAWRADRQGLFAGTEVMAKMGWHPGDHVTIKVLPSPQTPGGEVQAHVLGVASGYRATNVLVHYELLEQQFKLGKLSVIDVGCPAGGCAQVSEQIDAALANSAEPTQTAPVSAFFQRMLRAASAVPDLLSKIGLLIVIITGFITANAVAMSLGERRAELATLRAIGFTRGRILRQILVESVLLCAFGGVLGAVVPFLLFRTQGLDMGPWALKNVTVEPTVCAVGFGFSVVLGLVVALVPALGASRQDVVKAMASG